MKYSRNFYELLAHINPAMYDAIFPMNPFAHFNASSGSTPEFKLGAVPNNRKYFWHRLIR